MPAKRTQETEILRLGQIVVISAAAQHLAEATTTMAVKITKLFWIELVRLKKCKDVLHTF